ncbi:CHRD domain-containing protein [Salegentibacter sp. Hel_I_6]|uniref:CHRD domain-containing protein n=1 Tax=Salegentibacter sp. Hel_I_6 TaxID=1250278 RepID=UPI00055AC9AE|nr:CHRD domain-containing protein [Salegentibacter sp. Hel_I_6]
MKKLAFALMMVAGFTSCDSDDDGVETPEFQGETKEYTLNEIGDSGVSGTVTFMENEDGSTTVEFDLDGTPEDGMHPAHIHMGTAAETGEIAVSFEPIDGATGTSTTEVSTLDDGTSVSYEELLDFDGYINVHLSAEELATVVAQTDIGQNELTGESTSYDLASVDVDGIMGTAMFEERNNGETLVTIMLDGTPEGGEHPAHIHVGSVADAPGAIAISLNSVDGDTGMSMTNVAAFDGEDGEMIDYDGLLDYNGYLNVHLSAEDLDTLVAQGNVGANASEE